jgi:hypothetical protein
VSLEALRRGDLAGAKTLGLSCGLTEFPREIFGLADTLEVLDLAGNALSTLPKDMGRFTKLRVLFCSGNRFEQLPPSLGDCRSLSQIGFRKTGLREIPGESLAASLRWLTVTDNELKTLPDALGARPGLQKLMLSGNALEVLPDALAGAGNLELLRLSANRFSFLPGWITELPRLAWLAWAGNPLDQSRAIPPTQTIAWSQLTPQTVLGEGASGIVHRALWQEPNARQPRSVALKLFKGRMTSDGLPEREMAACLAAGAHPHLTYAHGRLTSHPQGLEGLIMPLLPTHWQVLAGPPSLESCSRDIYDPALRLAPAVVFRIARGVGMAATHLHAQCLLHGDLYAHNTLWDGTSGECVLSDFGGATFLPVGERGLALQRIEVRAWGILLGELLDRCAEELPVLRILQRQCMDTEPATRPLMIDALAALDAASPIVWQQSGEL